MSGLTNNGLFYLALAFVPMFGVRLALLQWVRRSQPTRPQVKRAWLAFAVAVVAWVAIVFEVIMPLAFGRYALWAP